MRLVESVDCGSLAADIQRPVRGYTQLDIIGHGRLFKDSFGHHRDPATMFKEPYETYPDSNRHMPVRFGTLVVEQRGYPKTQNVA